MTAGTLTAGPAALLASADWPASSADLDASGCAVTPRLLTAAQCRDLAGLYDQPELFRSTIDMGRHRFGSGQYRYFTHDLPEPVRALREAFTRTSCPSPGAGPAAWADPRRGQTFWGSGSGCATRPGSPGVPRSCGPGPSPAAPAACCLRVTA
jgi:hypothetical protein